jgi:cobyrinic acid a,c-diamide synthase
MGWLIAAPRSGAGKTTVTLGIVAALRRRGVVVRTAKSGPDYIDPAFHSAASGAPGTNLDSWAMPPPLLDRLFAQASEGADLLVVESAMGLFDGVTAPAGRTGSSADLAARFGLPVLLVLDVSGQAQTAAAVAHGLATFDPAVQVGGVILNRVGSEKHRRSVESAMTLPVLGAIPRDASLALPERHLGLVQAGEHPALAAALARLADVAERFVDLDRVLALAKQPSPRPSPAGGRGSSKQDPSLLPLPFTGEGRGERCCLPLPPPGQRIAIATDAAFTFTYPHLLAAWRDSGVELLPFSPLDNQPPPDHADTCWLPGGYPELHAAALAAADKFRAGLHEFARTRTVHGECGGYMVLGQSLTAADGTTHAMAGLLSHSTSFARRALHLGYRRALLPEGAVRGHEFHYATVTDPGTDAPYAEGEDAAGTSLGPSGGRRGTVTGSFFHAIAREQP